TSVLLLQSVLAQEKRAHEVAPAWINSISLASSALATDALRKFEAKQMVKMALGGMSPMTPATPALGGTDTPLVSRLSMLGMGRCPGNRIIQADMLPLAVSIGRDG